MNPDTSLVCFKAISNFTTELVELYGKQQRSLKLYGRLINKTTIVHDKSIKKHIDAFRDFCITNRDAIVTKSSDKLTMSKISYSQRVFIDMIEIFKLSDRETSTVIWEHLLCISALVDPAGKAREVLKANLESGGETNFLTNIIDNIEANVDPDGSPMDAVSSIMKSGIFTDLLSGMNNGLSDGSLDMGKLAGAVQGMVAQLGEQAGGDPQAAGAVNMISTLMSGLNTGENGAPPDLENMMKGMMSGLANSGESNLPTIEESITNEENDN